MDAINLSDAREVNAKVRERVKEICVSVYLDDSRVTCPLRKVGIY